MLACVSMCTNIADGFSLDKCIFFKPDTVAHVYNFGTQEAEAGRVPQVEGQLGLHEFQTNLGYTVKSVN